MHKELLSISATMRASIEVKHKTLPLPFFHRFPIACCEIASHYLARLVKQHLPDIDIRIIKGYNKQKNRWHYWVLADEWHLDITADQFGKHLSPVICNRVHPLGSEFEIEYMSGDEIFVSLSIGTAYGWSKEAGYLMVTESADNSHINGLLPNCGASVESQGRRTTDCRGAQRSGAP